MKVDTFVICWLITKEIIIGLLFGLQRKFLAIWYTFQFHIRFSFLIYSKTTTILKMLMFQLKAEPYRDVTDNKPNDTSPSFNDYNRLTSLFNETTQQYCRNHNHNQRDELNNYFNSSISSSTTTTGTSFSPSLMHHSVSDSTISYLDVTDNKTDTNPSIFREAPLTPSRRIMSEDLCREDERLKTFENRWPLSFMDKNVLAQTGMYYTGINDNVKCYFCEVEIGRWEVTDHPVNEHMRWSPNCPLLRRRSTNNIPLDAEALDRVLPAPSYDVCGSNEAIEIRPGAYAESSISSIENHSTIPATPTSPVGGSGYSYPDHPEYAIETARLRSFAEWPRTMKQKPKELSEAGFFYTGTGDRVKCFSCGGGLKDWDESDDPWEQHALWLSNCKYMKLMKGKAYIDSIIAKYKSPPAIKQECGNQTEDIIVEDGEQQKHDKTEDKNFSNGGGIDVNKNVSEAKASSEQQCCLEAKKITEEKLCKICYADEYNTAFLPCGHVVACAKCASSVTKCPMCRKPFKDVMRVYFS